MQSEQTSPPKPDGDTAPSVGGFSDEAIVDHMIAAIERTPERYEPFRHSYVEGVFPDGFYDAVDAAFPSPDAGMTVVAERRVVRDGYSKRRMTLSVAGMPEQELAAQPIALQQVKRVTTHPRLAQFLLGRFSSTLAPYLRAFHEDSGDTRNEHNVFIQRACELNYDATGFELRPHTDGNRKLVTFLIYFPTPDAPESLGTHIYGTRPGAEVSEDVRCGRLMMQWQDAVDFGAVPYRRNAMLLFPRTNESLHGVPTVECEHPRRAIQAAVIFGGLIAGARS